MSEREVELRIPPPTRRSARGVAAWLARVRAQVRQTPPPRWTFLVITPLGMHDRAWLSRQLQALGAPVQVWARIGRWPRFSTAVQVRRPDATRLRRAALFETVWTTLFPDHPAEVWGVEPRWHLQLAALKASLREPLPSRVVRLEGAERRCVLHPFHLADPAHRVSEGRRVLAALALHSVALHAGPRFSRRPSQRDGS